MRTKLTSRKFWICVAAFLASIAVSISGLHSNNEVIATIGIVCGIISAGIYAACEAMVDSAAVRRDLTDVMVKALNSCSSRPAGLKEGKDGDS